MKNSIKIQEKDQSMWIKRRRERSRLKRRKTAIKRENNRGNRSKKERGDEIRRDLREETIAVLIE